MSTPIRASDRDLRALAAIVSQDRPDLPDGEGLPPSLLADLMGQIRCDASRASTVRQRAAGVLVQAGNPGPPTLAAPTTSPGIGCSGSITGTASTAVTRTAPATCAASSTITDFYSARQWHSTGMYTDFYRPLGIEHELMLCLPEAPPRTAGPGRTVRLYLDPRARAGLLRARPGAADAAGARTCTRPTWTPSGAATRSPGSPPGRPACCAWWPPGTPTPRSPAGWASPREPCAPTWKTSTNGCTSPAAPPPSPARSPTGSPSVHGPGTSDVS